MIDIHPICPRDWDPSEPLVAYNKADRRVVVAAEMSRDAGSYYDRYGYQGSQEIVCIDCKQEGRDVPVILVVAEKRCVHFRHKQGEAPDGLGRHGETAEHLHGRLGPPPRRLKTCTGPFAPAADGCKPGE